MCQLLYEKPVFGSITNYPWTSLVVDVGVATLEATRVRLQFDAWSRDAKTSERHRLPSTHLPLRREDIRFDIPVTNMVLGR